MHEVSLERMVSEGCLKMIIIGGYSILKILIVRDGPIDIYTSEGCPQINIIILIRGLGECEGVSEDSGTRGSIRHSSRIMHLLECVFTLEHCICT